MQEAEADPGTGLVLRKPRQRSFAEDTCEARYMEDCEASRSLRMDLERKTTTLYAERPMMILPTDEYGRAKPMFSPGDGVNEFFQIVLPVKNIKIINGMNGREYSPADSASDGDPWNDNEASSNSIGIGKMNDDTFEDREQDDFGDEFNRRRGSSGYLEISCKSYDIKYL